MNAVTKVLVVLVLLLSAGFAASQIVLYGKREDFGAKYLETAQQLKDTAAELQKTDAALSDVSRDYDMAKAKWQTGKQALDSSLANERTRVRDLTADLVRANSTSEQLSVAVQDQEQRLATRESTVEGLRTTLAERDSTIKGNLDKIDGLEKTVAEKDATIGELNHELTETKKANVKLAASEKDLEDMIANLIKRGVEVEPTLAPAINGMVIKVGGDVAVIDRGALAA
ncbi:MAG: hypothetical protein KAX44_07750, partial [Candidatus Brocadiae bacterium]|nr:hypothetical protein [Candidatus Brocadiia bacterium]